MNTIKRIVCLANSRKLNDRCVAGKEISGGSPGGWIRPVSTREHGEISERERRYQHNGSDPCVLDIIDVPLLAPKPKDYQRENWLLDPNDYWVNAGRFAVSGLGKLVDRVAPLWINGHSTSQGQNDEIPLSDADSLASSLRLIHVKRCALRVVTTKRDAASPRRRVQAGFRHHSVDYHLWVTDPVYERAYLAKGDGVYEVGAAYLTISLSEPFAERKACYKLVAAIIQPGEAPTS